MAQLQQLGVDKHMGLFNRLFGQKPAPDISPEHVGEPREFRRIKLATRLAGFCAAHGIWCVADGGPLIPMLGFEKADGKRGMERFVASRLEEGVQAGFAWLSRNQQSAVQAAFVYDGFVTLPTGKVDALLVDVRSYGSPCHSLKMAVPYRPATPDQLFAVYRPKFLSCDIPGVAFEKLGVEFIHGVDSHTKAAPVWNKHLDQSL